MPDKEERELGAEEEPDPTANVDYLDRTREELEPAVIVMPDGKRVVMP